MPPYKINRNRADSSVTWYRVGNVGAEAERVPDEGRLRAQGAELRLAPALKADAGRYTCVARAPGGAAARRDFDMQVRSESLSIWIT